MQRLFNLFSGRSTFFAFVFSVAGITLAFEGKLTSQFALMVTAIQALIVAHSVKEDHFDKGN